MSDHLMSVRPDPHSLVVSEMEAVELRRLMGVARVGVVGLAYVAGCRAVDVHRMRRGVEPVSLRVSAAVRAMAHG